MLQSAETAAVSPIQFLCSLLSDIWLPLILCISFHSPSSETHKKTTKEKIKKNSLSPKTFPNINQPSYPFEEMDSFSFHNLQAEKANAILKNRKLRRITSLLRFVEVCVVLVLVSRLSLHLPVAVKSSSEYFRDLSVFVNSPRFVFLIGNVIIITLFAQSGQFSAQGSKRNDSEHDLYQEFLKNSTKNQSSQGNQKSRGNQNIETEDSIENIIIHQVEGEEKIKYPENNSARNSGNMKKDTEENRFHQRKVVNSGIRNKGIDAGKSKWQEKQRIKTGEANTGGGSEAVKKDYRRCQTGILCRVNSQKRPRGVLRRCETENRIKRIQKHDDVNEEEAEVSYPEDNMSNEEFRRTVEAFIERQQRLRREEEDYSLL